MTGKSKKQQRYASVWDAIEPSETEAANMKARSELMIAIQERGRFAENVLEPGQAVAIAARRWVVFRCGDGPE